jgi:fatty-acyl-CoA synthase
VASGYYKAPEGTSCVTDDGWLRTGDIVTIDARGSVQLRDRSKDLIKSGGEWISSVALENALMGHPAVAEAAVIAVPHPRWDERPLACVVLKPGGTATAEELREYLAPDFAKWWLPDAIEFVDHIPRTATGKFLKSALRERFKNYRLPTA